MYLLKAWYVRFEHMHMQLAVLIFIITREYTNETGAGVFPALFYPKQSTKPAV